MRDMLYWGVGIVAKIHNYIMDLNNAYETNFTDKDLHFLVLGILGLGLVFVIYPLFKYLAQQKKIMTIAWIYVTTVMFVITFAIEIGQKITNTGNMEFADIMYGMVGYFVMFAIFAVIRWIYRRICCLIRKQRRKQRTSDYTE